MAKQLTMKNFDYQEREGVYYSFEITGGIEKYKNVLLFLFNNKREMPNEIAKFENDSDNGMYVITSKSFEKAFDEWLQDNDGIRLRHKAKALIVDFEAMAKWDIDEYEDVVFNTYDIY